MNKFLYFLLIFFINIACENEKVKSTSLEKAKKDFISFKNLPHQLLFSINIESHKDSVINMLAEKDFIFDPSMNAYVYNSSESKTHIYPIFNKNKIHQLVIAFHFENEQQKAEQLKRVLNEISTNANRNSQNNQIHEYLFLNDQSPHLRILIEEKSMEFRVRMKLIQKI